MYNQKQKSLIVGSLLGDGYLTKPYGNKKQIYLEIQHSEKQLEYLKWLKKLFEENGFQVSQIYDVSQKYKAYRIAIKIEESYGKELRHQFYPNNNKVVTRHLLNLLDKQGLAIWFMDDGNRELHWRKDNSLSHWALGISTHSFTYEEHLIIQKYFKRVWDIEVSINKDRQYFRLRFNKINSPKFLNIIQDYIPECMDYKKTIPLTR